MLVLEGQQAIGGGCETGEMPLPGFKADWCSSSHVVINRNLMHICNEPHLDHYGYEVFRLDVVLHYPFSDGASFTVFLDDLGRTADTIALVSKRDLMQPHLAMFRISLAVKEPPRCPRLPPLHVRHEPARH